MAETQSSILIVDDDAEDLTSVERTLRSLGGELVTIKDPHEVIPRVHRHRPDVVILDALLPGLSGFDLCKQIKSDPQLKGTQVLILTGVYLRQQYRHEALQQFKADAFLTKPFRPPELQRLVVQLLSRKTRLPQSSFLKRIGLPASAEPRKKGFLGRIFGRGEDDELETVRIAPATRDVPQAPPVETASARVEAAPEIALEPPRTEAPPKPAAPEPPATPAEREPVEAPPAEIAPAAEAIEAPPEAAAQESTAAELVPERVAYPEVPGSEAAPEAGTIAVAAASPEPPQNSEPPVPADPAQETVEAESSEEVPKPPPAEAVVEEPSPPTLPDARPPSEPETVNWIQADSRTQDITLEQAASRVAEAPPAAFEDLAGQTEVRAEAEPKEESLPAADSSPTTRRPLFRVGEVPIYDEPDFLTELKRELSKCKRVDRPLTLILIRVGDLGQIIELFGRDFREPVLWHIAEQAMESLREVDLVGMMASKDRIAMTAFASDRYGGGRIVSRMRQAVTRKPFRVGEELPPIIPALDFGMATFPADGGEVANLMRRAEEDLTSAKDEAAGSD